MKEFLIQVMFATGVFFWIGAFLYYLGLLLCKLKLRKFGCCLMAMTTYRENLEKCCPYSCSRCGKCFFWTCSKNLDHKKEKKENDD